MTDHLSQELRSRNMAAVKGKNTLPEMVVRRLLHRLGYRYRLHAKDLPGKPDIVNRSRKKAVFVHGCFWHGHGCKRGNRQPKTNADYWLQKIDRNAERDHRHIAELEAAGWDVLVIWESEIKRDDLTQRLQSFMNGGRE